MQPAPPLAFLGDVNLRIFTTERIGQFLNRLGDRRFGRIFDKRDAVIAYIDHHTIIVGNLPENFTTYRFFDNLDSVSEELARVNSTNLSEYAPQESFTYAHNTIDYRHILRRAQEPMEQGSEPNEWRWRPNRPGEKTFVAVGRLSTEKNHERLIRAFGKVHAKDAQTRLIILGTGPLAEHLDQLTQDLGLVDAVELAGFQPNPYPAMAGADCFVLSSDHEGQPMVILEALVLGLPVVATDFSSSASAMPEGTGLIVPRSMDGVESGLAAFLAGEIPNPPFDPVAYNQRAVAEFYQAIGAGPDPT